jgi:hypothetical protein
LRRKILQDFANVFCQQFVDLGSGHDVATFVDLGSGKYVLDILSGECSRNGVPIAELKICSHYRTWLSEQVAKHNVPPGLLRVGLTVDIVVANVTVSSSYGHRFGAADFTFNCRSELRTDEKVYVGELSGSRRWGFEPRREAPWWRFWNRGARCPTIG